MRPRPTQVPEQLRVAAAGRFEGVGQGGEAVEGSAIVDDIRHPWDRSVVMDEPGGV